jgi:uncharacterized lipoprotein YajG
MKKLLLTTIAMLFLSGCATNNVAEEVLRVFIAPDGTIITEWY